MSLSVVTLVVGGVALWRAKPRGYTRDVFLPFAPRVLREVPIHPRGRHRRLPCRAVRRSSLMIASFTDASSSRSSLIIAARSMLPSHKKGGQSAKDILFMEFLCESACGVPNCRSSRLSARTPFCYIPSRQELVSLSLCVAFSRTRTDQRRSCRDRRVRGRARRRTRDRRGGFDPCAEGPWRRCARDAMEAPRGRTCRGG